MFELPAGSPLKIAVIGLGYVGLPLAVEFGAKIPTIGFDVNFLRVEELKRGTDTTLEVSPDQLASATQLQFTSELNDIKSCNFYIIAVPTPIDSSNRPDLTPLLKASTAVASVMGKGDYVVYESTVYPGATEEDCVPVLEKQSSLKFNVDFLVGYSPERINPGDKEHRLPDIVKVTSGSTAEAASVVDDIYKLIIRAGTHKAPSIRVAEAAKVIENVQRDVNISLINELAMLFGRLGIDTNDVLDAASTKWNFLRFRPGLVGGHCIGVDPYYLLHKSQSAGFYPEVIDSGRRVNHKMGQYVTQRVVMGMLSKQADLSDARVLIAGFAFKGNCPDIRNTKIVDVIRELKKIGLNVDIHDPWVSHEEVKEEYGLAIIDEPHEKIYDAIVFAVEHEQYVKFGGDYVNKWAKSTCFVFDVKNILPVGVADQRL